MVMDMIEHLKKQTYVYVYTQKAALILFKNQQKAIIKARAGLVFMSFGT